MRRCSIGGCSKKHYARGWCEMHYQRWKNHGDPLKNPRGDVSKFFETHVLETSEACRIWPYGKADGYRKIGNRNVHALVCERWHGPKPFHEAEVAHSCGNKICWAGEHLRWASPKDNEADKLLHGTHVCGERHGRAILTEKEVRKIRKDYAEGGMSQGTLADQYGITQTSISRIIRREAWGWLE